MGKRVALQGNLDPVVLLTTPEAVCEQARIVLDAAGSSPGHVFNLGHGITPTTPPENVAALVDFVHTESQKRLAPRRLFARGSNRAKPRRYWLREGLTKGENLLSRVLLMHSGYQLDASLRRPPAAFRFESISY